MEPKRLVGPLDKRRKAWRCGCCTRKHLKCEGGTPCSNCTRSNSTCLPLQKRRDNTLVFVRQSPPDDPQGNSGQRSTARIGEHKNPGIRLMNLISKEQSGLFLDCFVLFMHRNSFTMGLPFIIPDLLSLASTSPVLRHAMIAIGSLDASRRGSVCAFAEGQTPYVASRDAYFASLVVLRSSLEEKEVMHRDDVLWATFFLGLFELLSDPSGDGWVKHMLFGTSRMLQLAGPRDKMSSLRKAFYDLFRVLEASRVLLFNEETILSQECWLHPRNTTYTPDNCQWDPMGEIATLMIQTSAFSLRARATMEKIPEIERYTNHSLVLIGTEGLRIQQSIYNWHTEALLQLSQRGPNTYLNLAFLYYHALAIFLSGNYDYFPYWRDIPAPVLSLAEVSHHVVAILELAEEVLFQSRIPGVMLFFPVAVAAARARHIDQRSKIQSFLESIFREGFVVASQLHNDLLENWRDRDQMQAVHQVAGKEAPRLSPYPFQLCEQSSWKCMRRS